MKIIIAKLFINAAYSFYCEYAINGGRDDAAGSYVINKINFIFAEERDRVKCWRISNGTNMFSLLFSVSKIVYGSSPIFTKNSNHPEGHNYFRSISD